jgi:hypothetical protein
LVLRLEAIQFNHDSCSASVDAFNIRKNQKEFVEVPEWRRNVSINPEDSPAAYALCETRGNTLTIRARFSWDDRGVSPVDIRALDGRINPKPGNNSAFSASAVRLLRPVLRSSIGNVLGEVAQQNIKPCEDETVFHEFELKNVRIWDAGVGVQDIVWRWQYRLSGTSNWIDFALTTHRVYTVLQVPKRPWLQEHDPSNTQLPWLEVLDHACNWASGAADPNDAAQLVTLRVHDLGLGVVSYEGSAYYTDQEDFDCESFLDVLRGGIGGGAHVNCDDCAAIVSTFANALGCNLEQLCIVPFNSSEYRLKPHTRIGIPGWVFNEEFVHHSVASEGCMEQHEVFDACLQIDDDDKPGILIAVQPTNLRFGHLLEDGYRSRLVIKEDLENCVLGPCRRRHLGPAEKVLSPCANILDLKKRYDFHYWALTESTDARLYLSKILFADYILPAWRLIRDRPSSDTAQPPSIQSFWELRQKSGETVMRIDAYECISSAEARKALMSLLTGLERPSATLQQDAELGDVAFADGGFTSILFSTHNLAFFLRNAGKENVPLTEVAKAINHAIHKSLHSTPAQVG